MLAFSRCRHLRFSPLCWHVRVGGASVCCWRAPACVESSAFETGAACCFVVNAYVLSDRLLHHSSCLAHQRGSLPCAYIISRISLLHTFSTLCLASFAYPPIPPCLPSAGTVLCTHLTCTVALRDFGWVLVTPPPKVVRGIRRG